MYKTVITFTLFFLVSKIFVLEAQNRILFITSNQATYGSTTIKTANHFGEIVEAYDVFVNNGFKVDFVSPNGGEIPIGYVNKSNLNHIKYFNDPVFIKRLKATLKPEDVVARKYKAVYYSGGGAAMFGVPENKSIQKIVIEIYKNRGVVSSVCHGTAGIVNLKDDNEQLIYKGKNVTGFPDKFERVTKAYYKTFPFSIERIIEKNGANFQYSKAGWDNFFVVDGRLVTGQDPTSSRSVAEQVIKIINNK